MRVLIRRAGIETPIEVRAYLSAIVRSFCDVLGDGLAGLYVCGSIVQDDFEAGRSDIDLLGVVSDELDEQTRKQLAAHLSSMTRPVPAQGLEVVLFALSAARSPRVDFPFTFALSTGRDGACECEPPGMADDMLIDIVLCREAGVTLAGAPAKTLFAPVPQRLLLHALIKELQWHKRAVLEAGGGVAAVNAILNAARSLHAAETGRILSKTEGGRWWLRRRPSDDLVALALSRRERGHAAPIDPVIATEFVDAVIHQIEARRSRGHSTRAPQMNGKS